MKFLKKKMNLNERLWWETYYYQVLAHPALDKALTIKGIAKEKTL